MPGQGRQPFTASLERILEFQRLPQELNPDDFRLSAFGFPEPIKPRRVQLSDYRIPLIVCCFGLLVFAWRIKTKRAET